MNFAVKKKLKDIIDRYGVSILNEPKRIEAILKDYCYENRKEIFLIMSCINENIILELQNIRHIEVQLGIVNKLIKRLCDNLGITEDNAKWAVEAWIYALNLQIKGFARKNNIINDSNYTWKVLDQIKEISAITLSLDEKYLAYGDSEGKIQVYELSSGNKIMTFNHEKEVEFLQFSSNGTILLSAANNDVKYYKKLFSEDNYIAIITDSNRLIRLWDDIHIATIKNI